ncbi:MAG: UDP-N-acetylglucosamine pyrophosphorylase [Firmicutes bacterium]|nr:UDP-N-acetylglucosamine pyrophosphorylase [Bacillota bacterium]
MDKKAPTINEMMDLSHTIAAPLFEGKTYAWEVLDGIKDFILKLGPTLPKDEFDNPKEGVWIAKDADVFDSAYIGAPCIIDHKAKVRHCAFIRESAIVGKGATVGNSVELKNVILFDDVETPHYNYVGDSVLGWHAHMGVGSITSNVKADRKNVVVHSEPPIETGRRKFGAILGDYAEIGCNAVLNPGTVVGSHSNVYPTTGVRGVIPNNCIVKDPNTIVEKK